LFFNKSSYLSEAVGSCLLVALTDAPFDSGSRTLSAWPNDGMSVAPSDLLLAFGFALAPQSGM
jgi:hypothetical protein